MIKICKDKSPRYEYVIWDGTVDALRSICEMYAAGIGTGDKKIEVRLSTGATMSFTSPAQIPEQMPELGPEIWLPKRHPTYVDPLGTYHKGMFVIVRVKHGGWPSVMAIEEFNKLYQSVEE